MFLLEYDEEEILERARRVAREEGLEQGREEGLERGLEQGREEERASFLERAAKMVRDGTLALADASAGFGFSEDEISELL